ncbi:cell envelope-related transcriptional attenuator [Pseudonocardia dioxanivorans CB1190]|uniref:Cell envelope-related transcriptional attenuator n=1 Tax=Pseudonocardia dioxanivorans (strain ATCC 55486 / DSM 44775 / JCM 13855 / CB1190) TaxID=675635 RepID=F4CWU8_PSEUX|nr:cell envelope-related transcriptional attenuator [Pseudonocardia dioxanivorans CB1190]
MQPFASGPDASAGRRPGPGRPRPPRPPDEGTPPRQSADGGPPRTPDNGPPRTAHSGPPRTPDSGPGGRPGAGGAAPRRPGSAPADRPPADRPPGAPGPDRSPGAPPPPPPDRSPGGPRRPADPARPAGDGTPRPPDAPARRADGPNRPSGAAARRGRRPGPQRPPGPLPGADDARPTVPALSRAAVLPDDGSGTDTGADTPGRGPGSRAAAVDDQPTSRVTDGPARRDGPDADRPARPERLRGAGPTRPPARAGTPPARTGPGGRRRGLGAALGITAASTLVPGSGHLILGRRRAGTAILTVFLLAIAALVTLALVGRSTLIESALSARVLAGVAVVVLAAALGWIVVIVRTWALARPPGMKTGQQALGTLVVVALCLVVAAPFGFAADIANSQRNLLNELFKGGGTSAEEAINKPRLNVLMIGSDAGPDRTGTRTDTMMVASIDTHTAKTILFGLPRNIQRAQFPPGSPMAERFPNGFRDPRDPLSGNYLLNAVYAYAHQNPGVAPAGPSADPGINLLMQSVTYMLDLPLDYFLEVDMEGFSALIDALGGVTVDVGPVPLPIGGVLPDGRHVRPDGYIQPGVQRLDGEQALWFARSRRDSSDYDRMGRQRCLIQAVLDQKSPASLLSNFQTVAKVATQNIDTNIPQALLPHLVSLIDDKGVNLSSVTFDPTLPDPNERDGHFNPGAPDPSYMREVVAASIDGKPLPAPTTTPTTSRSTRSAAPTTAPTTTPQSTAPVSLAASCSASDSPQPPATR